MLDVSGEILKVALIGTAGYLGKIGQDWLTARRAQTRAGQERWEQDKRQYYLPLLGAARALDARVDVARADLSGSRAPGAAHPRLVVPGLPRALPARPRRDP